jgi:hypothetical protein
MLESFNYRGWQILLFQGKNREQIRTECIDPQGKKLVNTILLFNSCEEALVYTQRYIDHLMR